MIIDYVINENTTQWTRCIVGFFLGYVMPYQAMKSIGMRAWKLYGLEHVMFLDGFIIFRFKDKKGVHLILKEDSWMFGGKHLVL